MKTFYNQAGIIIGQAYFDASCLAHDRKIEHEPHVYEDELLMGGPYMCPGYPQVAIYDTPPRLALNRENLKRQKNEG